MGSRAVATEGHNATSHPCTRRSGGAVGARSCGRETLSPHARRACRPDCTALACHGPYAHATAGATSIALS